MKIIDVQKNVKVLAIMRSKATFSPCSVNLICSRPRTPSVELPRFQANAAHAGGGFPQGAAMSKLVDMVGRRFGRLIVIKQDGYDNHNAAWECACECGKTHRARGTHLRSGRIKSCGCLNRDMVIARHLTHGLTGTTEYGSWIAMRGRCYDQKHNNQFKNYGGRGIVVCDRWRNSFENFLSDMGPKPSAAYSIERRDNNGNYEPSNCCWADAKTQQSNKRNTHFVTFEGKTFSCAEWDRLLGFGRQLVYSRIRKGWSTEKAITTMPRITTRATV